MDALAKVPMRAWTAAAAIVLVAIYGASMASTGAWDPWETHYGEVARQMLARHDAMDLYWRPGNGGPDGAYEKAFWSKPPLSYWLMAVSMWVFGVGTSADPAEMVRPLWPELAIRMPSMLAGLLGAVFLGWVVARMSSRRAGLITAVVLLTMPQWAIVTRQALTDMFFVGPVVLAMGMWLLAWGQPERALRTKGEGLRCIPWDRAYVAFLVFFVLSALVPLAVMHLQSIDAGTIERVIDERGKRHARSLHTIFVHLWAYWIIAAAVLIASLRWRRRSQPLMGILYLSTGLSLIGKGMIGPGLIGLMCLAHIAVTGRWSILRRCALPLGVLLFVLVSFPWHHGMILFRGERFVREWILENNLQRFATGEQKQAVGSFAFYVRTLGIAALPWAAVVPLAVWRAIGAHRRRADGDAHATMRVELHRFALLWLVVSLWAVTYSVTKYYHYLLPCLPPLAVLIGLWIDELLGQRRDGRSRVVALVGCLLGVVVLVLVVRDAMHEPAWIAHLTTYLYTGMWRKGAPEVDRLIWTCAPFAVGLVLYVAGRMRSSLVAMVLSALMTTTYVIDDYLPAASESWSQRSMFRTYFENRGPEDRLVSWWFYYRGETYFSKRDIWVMKEQNREKLAELIEERKGKGGTLWFVTTVSHGRRIRSHIPYEYRDGLEQVYESFHYTMFKVPIP